MKPKHIGICWIPPVSVVEEALKAMLEDIQAKKGGE